MGDKMLEREIEELRQQLHKLISENESYEEIYRLSMQLDLLINDFYRFRVLSTQTV